MANQISNLDEMIPVPSDLLMDGEDIFETGKQSFHEYTATKTTFKGSESAKIVIDSQTGYFYPNKSSYCFDVRITTDATANCSSIGLGGIIQTVQERISGTQVESRNYNPLCYMADLATDDAQQQICWNDLNGWVPNVKGATYDATPTDGICVLGSINSIVVPKSSGNVLSVAVPFQSQFCGGNSPLPLAQITGGLEQNITFAPNSDILQSSSLVYEITNFRICACIVEPAPAIFAQHKAILESGGALTLYTEMNQVYNFQLGASSTPRVSLLTQKVNSLNQIHVIMRTAKSAGEDYYGTSNIKNVKSWSVHIGTEKYPPGFDIQVCPTTSTSSKQSEMLAVQFLSNKNRASFAKFYNPLETRSALTYSFKSHPQALFTGQPIQDGCINLNFNLTSPASTDECYLVTSYDTRVSISRNRIDIYV